MALKTARNPQNAQPLTDLEVIVSFAEDPKIGLDGVPSEEWETAGIINQGSKAELNRTVDKEKISGIGFGVVAVTSKPGELTGSCEVLERNEVTEKIAWPHRTKDGVLIHDAEIARCHVAYCETLQDGSKRIRATRVKAFATMEDLGASEAVEGKTISFDFMTGEQKDAFDEHIIAPSGESVPSDVTRIRFAEGTGAGTGPEEPAAG